MSCDGSAARRSPSCVRRSKRSTAARSRRSCPAGRASTAIRPRAPGSIGCARRSCRCRGIALPADAWERDVLPRRLGAYSPAWMDQLTASGEVVWVGAGALGRNSGRVALYFRDDAAAIGRPGTRGPAAPPPADPVHEAIRERLATAPCFFTDLLAELAGFSPEELQEGLWDLAWAGEATNDAFAPLRAPRLTLARAQRARAGSRPASRRFGARRGAGAQAQVQGRWSLVGPAVRCGSGPARAAAHDRRAAARALRNRHPRAGARRGRARAASRRSTRRSATSRRSASAAAATSSKDSAARSSRCPGRSSGCGARREDRRGPPSSSPRRIRHSRTVASCAGPSAPVSRAARSASRARTSSSSVACR